MKFQTSPGWVPHKCLKGSHPEKNYKCLSVSTPRIGSAQPVRERFEHCFRRSYHVGSRSEQFVGLQSVSTINITVQKCMISQSGEKKENKFQFMYLIETGGRSGREPNPPIKFFLSQLLKQPSKFSWASLPLTLIIFDEGETKMPFIIFAKD
jgi:hypothetical protein